LFQRERILELLGIALAVHNGPNSGKLFLLGRFNFLVTECLPIIGGTLCVGCLSKKLAIQFS
jgi:hypothetical protein